MGIEGSKLIDTIALMQLAFSLRPLRSLWLKNQGCLASIGAMLSTRSTRSTRLESVWLRETLFPGGQ